jgi:transcription elongation GreA/GreB family factor
MSTSPHPLTPRQEQSITALLVQGSLQAAAAASGINEKTLRRWLRDDAAFQIAYREARRAVVQHAITQVQQATGEAVETLRAVMQDPAAPASAKVSAAKNILDTAVKAVELEDLEARITALEQQARTP